MAASCRGIDPEERDALTGQIATVITARMVVELQNFEELPEGPAKTAAWRDLVWSLVLLRRGEFYAGKLQLEKEKLSLNRKEEKAPEEPLCKQQVNEIFRMSHGLGGPHWNNFAKRWEGPGAEEMTERDEVDVRVVAEVRRLKAERAAQAAQAAKDAQAAQQPPQPAKPVPPAEAATVTKSSAAVPAASPGGVPPPLTEKSSGGTPDKLAGGDARATVPTAVPVAAAQPALSSQPLRMGGAANLLKPPICISRQKRIYPSPEEIERRKLVFLATGHPPHIYKYFPALEPDPGNKQT
jgi:hypothetical protein